MSIRKVLMISAVPLMLASAALAENPPQSMPGWGKHDHAAMHQQMCSEMYARQSARMAYLDAKLDLTAQQRPLFEKWRQSVVESAAGERALCQSVTVKNDAPPTIVERHEHMEKMLEAKVKAMQASTPALKALYDSLTPAQRTTLDRPSHGHFGRHEGMGMEGMGMGHGGGMPSEPKP